MHRQHWLPLRNCSFHTCFPLNETITTRFRLISEIYLQRSLPASQYMSEYYIVYRVCSWFYDLSRLCVASVTENATDTGKEERVLEWGRVQLVLRGRLDGGQCYLWGGCWGLSSRMPAACLPAGTSHKEVWHKLWILMSSVCAHKAFHFLSCQRGTGGGWVRWVRPRLCDFYKFCKCNKTLDSNKFVLRHSKSILIGSSSGNRICQFGISHWNVVKNKNY